MNGTSKLLLFRELKAYQSDLDVTKKHGENHLDCYHTAHTGNPVDASEHEFMKDKSYLTSITSFYEKLTSHLVDEGKALHAPCLDFGKAFDAVSHSILWGSGCSWLE